MRADRPTRASLAGRMYLDLRRKARADGRATDEYVRLYALEGFLGRLAASGHANDLVLKGGVLLAAYAVRRPTADIDVAGISLSGDTEQVRDLVASIVAIDAEDGLDFDRSSIRADQIRDDDQYAGVRVSMSARLATAVIRFHVDVNFGDPIWPPPQQVRLPRLLGGEMFVMGYPLVMVFAEKLVTALERATANTRWRDFADIYLLSGSQTVTAADLIHAIRVVATHRGISSRPLSAVLAGYADLAAARWVAWREKQGLEAVLPREFADVLVAVSDFADPVLVGNLTLQNWDHKSRHWTD